MPAHYEIRADFDQTSIVVYQAYPAAIALPAIREGRFVAPFSFNRMTWIKPSFLWLMERSDWGRKAGQEHILKVRITRAGWEEALSAAVLTHPEKSIYKNADDWRSQFEKALVHVQWDPERSIRGAALPYDSIQMGLSRHIIRRFVDEWIVVIEDITPLARKIHGLIKSGGADRAKRYLPPERLYPLDPAIERRLMISPAG